MISTLTASIFEDLKCLTRMNNNPCIFVSVNDTHTQEGGQRGGTVVPYFSPYFSYITSGNFIFSTSILLQYVHVLTEILLLIHVLTQSAQLSTGILAFCWSIIIINQNNSTV